MSVSTYTGSERPVITEGIEYAPCCGKTPMKHHYKRAQMVSLHCQNPSCENHEGVLCYENDKTKWEKFRVKG